VLDMLYESSTQQAEQIVNMILHTQNQHNSTAFQIQAPPAPPAAPQAGPRPPGAPGVAGGVAMPLARPNPAAAPQILPPAATASYRQEIDIEYVAPYVPPIDKIQNLTWV
jgi:hypothetical protein